jgi:hypothetical protein
MCEWFDNPKLMVPGPPSNRIWLDCCGLRSRYVIMTPPETAWYLCY